MAQKIKKIPCIYYEDDVVQEGESCCFFVNGSKINVVLAKSESVTLIKEKPVNITKQCPSEGIVAVNGLDCTHSSFYLIQLSGDLYRLSITLPTQLTTDLPLNPDHLPDMKHLSIKTRPPRICKKLFSEEFTDDDCKDEG